MGGYYYGFKPYVPVAKRRAQAAREVARRIKQGEAVSPVQIEGRTIASTFWGRAWCTNLESYSDFANRLPRGRTYARNGSVVHLAIDERRIEALVSGSELYTIRIEIKPLPKTRWRALKQASAGKLGTLVELLQGKLSKAMMELVTGREHGLFPRPNEITFRCSCPDGAWMCKHIAAVLYGVGNRLDSHPEMLFLLRGVNHLELIEQAIPTAPLAKTGMAPTISADDLESIFNIELGEASAPAEPNSAPRKPAAKPTHKKPRAVKDASPRNAASTIPTKPVAKPAATKAHGDKKPTSARQPTQPKPKPASKKAQGRAGRPLPPRS